MQVAQRYKYRNYIQIQSPFFFLKIFINKQFAELSVCIDLAPFSWLNEERALKVFVLGRWLIIGDSWLVQLFHIIIYF